ncbi:MULTISPECIES: sulfotransferase family protein [Ralstonia solanacearum species complex]|uniref:sulfotransferase family protein n=1 Tax=Ralstonia solanacearum species complex TaxID=3116862 RepID=UPI000E57CFF5|nr:sulfotransferase [Ralstonia solanacearum]AXV78700.1 sulfotransferase family protein [Ralstonia solanacearum]AXV92722.1 sulfotransferase family protein [Ralstonia solanacearum]AXW20796.1 sulfotransferase family protein [Ralstonia solanacearum]AXW77618.1 sulfotransferase family protein [Ralstonia solanacearum]
MTAKFHFIAGLPRSGSTLLAALLRQNPRFHASMSSPLARMTSSVLVEMTGEDGPLVSPDKRRGVLRGLFDAYYAEESATREVIFDTNRGWGTRLPLLAELFGDVKMICMVRDVASVMDSFEVLVRKNVFERSGLFLDERERATVYSRTEALLLPNRTIGYALASLKEAVYGEHARSVLVVEYDQLVRFPAQTLRLIYQFLGEPLFEHSLDTLHYDEPGFDNGIATPGLHLVRPSIQTIARRTVLPPDLHERLSQLSFWRQPGYSQAHIVRHANAGAGDADGAAKLVIASADEVSEPDLLPELHRLP